jgi:hypothetical protein
MIVDPVQKLRKMGLETLNIRPVGLYLQECLIQCLAGFDDFWDHDVGG